ncbi:MAG TPA: TonB-dependent receptor, partial [Opitutaceae bacterium]|nr:TonB-dependent receptor [Opitutaceae bacterium]
MRRRLLAAALAGVLAPGLSPARGQLTGEAVADNATAYKQMSLEQLMNLDVTSVSREPERYAEAPAAIDVVTGDDIARSGATSIPEALQLADNLEVAQKTSHDWAISARGFDTALSNKLLVLMDGRTVYTPLFSGVFWDVQDYLLADLDRIEVISGPGGSLWGANAVNGVINITTKSAKDTQGGYLEAGGGSQLRDFFGARYGAELAPDVFVRVYGKYFEQDSEELSDGQPANDNWRMRQGGFRLDSLAVANTTLTLQGDIYDGLEHVTTGGEAAVDGGNVLGRWSRTFSPDADLSLQLYYDRTHLEDPIPASAFARAGILTDALDTYDLDFQDHFTLAGTNNILWGLGYRFTRDDVGNAPGLAFYPVRLDQKLLSAFLQDEIRLRPDLHLTVGSKIEHNDYTGGELEPSARLAWTPAQNQTV